MEAADEAPLGRQLEVVERLAYRVPVGWVLHGLLAENSAASHPAFYLWMVRMPLVVPTHVLDLSWSERFGGPSRVFDPSAAATHDAVAHAARLVSEDAASDAVLVEPPGGVESLHMKEARAYGLLLMGDTGGAIETLGPVLRYEPHYPWEQELVRRAGEVRSLVADGRTEETRRRLEAWRSDALRALGINSR